MAMASRPHLGSPTADDRAWHAHLRERFGDRCGHLSPAEKRERVVRQARIATRSERPMPECVKRAGSMAALMAGSVVCGTATCGTCPANTPESRAAIKRAGY